MTIYRAVNEGVFSAIRTRGRISIPAKAIDAMEEVAVAQMRAVDSSEFTLPKTGSRGGGSR
ncbi:hypothetical protein ACIRSS_23140 [Amycolatopsis sp. NPDC101161]|uniref:hypothetical protein n=1 Tax=Amycolatopsis sp. NPDC101161 TaxID=3363940 RepID=UPI0037F4DCE7